MHLTHDLDGPWVVPRVNDALTAGAPRAQAAEPHAHMAELLQHSRSSAKQWEKADKREGGRGNLRREVVNLMSAVGLAFCCRWHNEFCLGYTPRRAGTTA
jgi:hypothetical protein